MSQLSVLILPGTLCTGAMFKHQIKHLSQFCDDIKVVQFSTEASLAEMVKTVIAATNNKPCAMIGFSMGGIVAMALAKSHPELIAKLALINSNCHADLPERKAARAGQIEQALSGGFTKLIKNTLLPNYLYSANKAYETIIVEMAETLGADCFAAQVLAIEGRGDSLSILQKLEADIAIISGMQDKLCPPEHQKLMHAAIGNSQLTLLEQCGHFSPLEQANQVSSLLEQWYLSI